MPAVGSFEGADPTFTEPFSCAQQNGGETVRRSAAGIPADMGVVTMNQSWVEKNECCRHTATTSRPV